MASRYMSHVIEFYSLQFVLFEGIMPLTLTLRGEKLWLLKL